MADPTNQTVELLAAMIRNRCVNDGTAASGQEVRNAETLIDYLDLKPGDYERFEPEPGRVSIVTRIEGRDPTAPSLCLMGHTDVVPANPDGWRHDPFGGEVIDGEVWGRGAVDMLNQTASMAVAFRHLKDSGFRPTGDLIYFAVADEEAGSKYGAAWVADNHREAIEATYVLTENGGLHSGTAQHPRITVNVGEKGVAWRRLLVRGIPGHGSMPFKSSNALVDAAAVIQRLADYRPPARLGELWAGQVAAMDLDEETAAMLTDANRIDELLDSMPRESSAPFIHACTHTTFSPNLVNGGPMKANVIPDQVEIQVDIRTLPGEGEADVDAHLQKALGDLYDRVQVEVITNNPASMSQTNNPLWDALARAAENAFPGTSLLPQTTVGFTDARVFRAMGSIAYGAGLFSPDLDPADFSRRFHGNDERIDIESLRLTTDLWIGVAKDLLG